MRSGRPTYGFTEAQVMIVSPGWRCGIVYLERKKKGWMFVAKVLSHCSLVPVNHSYPPERGQRRGRKRLTLRARKYPPSCPASHDSKQEY